MGKHLEPDDPRFHHDRRGYRVGHRCDACVRDFRKVDKRLKYARLTGQPTPNQLIDNTPVREHLLGLIAKHPGIISRNIFVQASGVDKDVIDRVTNKRAHSIRRAHADALLGVTEAAALRCAHLVSRDLPRQQSWSLRAQGFPLHWQCEQVGLTRMIWVYPEATQRVVTIETAAAMAALAKRIGDRRSTLKEDGITALRSQRACREAARQGWYPAIYYDESGRLVETPEQAEREHGEDRAAS